MFTYTDCGKPTSQVSFDVVKRNLLNDDISFNSNDTSSSDGL